ncbi:MAG: hypothetical protein AB8G11_09665 [Saprospiraceae bacterium]
MAKMMYGSIDVTKIDKSKIVSTNDKGEPFKNGGKFLSVVVWVNDEDDNYGNIASIQQSLSKEERDSGVKPTYLGNLKEFRQGNAQGSAPASTPVQNSVSDEDDQLPF